MQSATLVESLVSIWAQITRRLSENSTEFEPPPICLLMAIVAEEGEYHQVILQWCVDNGFEIIEWTPGIIQCVNLDMKCECLHERW